MMKVPKVRRMDMVVRLMWMRLAKWNKEGESSETRKGVGGHRLRRGEDSRSPLLSMREEVLTVSPKRQYRGILTPTTPAQTGPKC